MYVLALSDYKQPAAAAGYKPAPQLGRYIAVYPSVLRTLEYHLATKVEGLVVRDACEETEVEKVSAYAVT